jgi:hypothetical protein
MHYMNAQDVLQGRRLPDAAMSERGPGWEAWEAREPGDYMKVENGTERPYWYVCDPDGKVGTLLSSHHVVTEHEDGTISVTPSVLDDDPRPAIEQLGGELGAIAGPGYHGFLERGVWTRA